jgi:hypothetical protein
MYFPGIYTSSKQRKAEHGKDVYGFRSYYVSNKWGEISFPKADTL